MAIPHRPLLLTNARLIDPASNLDVVGGVLLEDGRIRDLGPRIRKDTIGRDAAVQDCSGLTIGPGLVDLRVFIGEPGQESRETFRSASEAAAAGGVTTLLMMPDTEPAVDDPAVIDFIIRRAGEQSLVNVLPAAALTKRREGREMSEIGLLAEAGARAFTDGARAVRNPQILRRAMIYGRRFDALIMGHLEDADLAANGVMNEGELSARLGLPGIPIEAETVTLERDLRLAAATGARYHASVVSAAQSLGILERARQSGQTASAGTSINHLTLNEADVVGYRTFLKVAPPLRPEADRLALVQAVADGLIDIIVSDHDPQGTESKRQPFAEAATGAAGLETFLAAGLRLVQARALTVHQLFAAASARPAALIGSKAGRLAKGAPADLVVFDPDEPWLVERDRLRSRSKNTPFDDARMLGRVKLTIVAGKIVFSQTA
jgi:dihydroorotase